MMFYNYFARAVANLFRYKLYSFINIVGLAIGMTACGLILLYVQNESSYDKHWQDSDRLFRVNTTFDLPGRDPFRLSVGSALLLPAIQEYFSEEIALGTRTRALPLDFIVDNNVSNETLVEVDKEFLQLFNLETIKGSLDTALGDTSGIALSEATALALYGTLEVTGRVLTLEYQNTRNDYRVAAVYRLPKGNTVLDVPALTLFDPTRDDFEIHKWTRSPVSTWLKLTPAFEVANINARLNAFSDQYADISDARLGPEVKASAILRYDVQNIRELHLDATFEDVGASGNKTTVQAFAVIAVLILLVACINFTSLATARSTLRALDVAVRQAAGASRAQLITQFLSESLLTVLLAMLLAWVLGEVSLPVFESFFGSKMDMFTASAETSLGFVLLFALVVFISGFYPALVLSYSRPARILKGTRSVESSSSISLRNALVIFQFGVSVALIIATCIIYLQVQFVSKRDAGFDKNNLIVIEDLYARAEVKERKYTLKQELAKLPGISSVSLSGHRPLADTTFARTSIPYGVQGEQGSSYIIPSVSVDENFLATYGMDFITGRNFSLERDRPSQIGQPGLRLEDIAPRTALLNESAVRQLGFGSNEEALGRVLTYPSQFPGVNHEFAIVGVVADSQFYSLKVVPRSEVYIFQPDFTDVMTVKYTGAPAAAMMQIRSAWEAVMGPAVFSGVYLDQYLDQEFAQETKEGMMLIGFALLSLLIACLGLYGTAVFTVDRRTREIGIRKVMGAEVREIISLLLWQFTKPVLFANIIAWPLALWAMLTWLQRFPYRIEVLVLFPLCVLAGVIALSIAWLTVLSNAARVANTKPVYALRYE